MAITIKKRVSLDYLGDEFKDSWLEFKSIAVREYAEIQKQTKAIGEDNEKAFAYMIEQLTSRFQDGIVQGQKVTSADLEDLPGDVFLRCFKEIQGNLDPKA